MHVTSENLSVIIAFLQSYNHAHAGHYYSTKIITLFISFSPASYDVILLIHILNRQIVYVSVYNKFSSVSLFILYCLYISFHNTYTLTYFFNTLSLFNTTLLMFASDKSIIIFLSDSDNFSYNSIKQILLYGIHFTLSALYLK